MTDEDRAREVARLITEAMQLADTPRLATVHYLLSIVAIEAIREVPEPFGGDFPPGVVPLRRRDGRARMARTRGAEIIDE